jgi:L-threonylcarbamoyladenylate synthase
MLESHYAPRCEVRLVDHLDDALALRSGTPSARVLDLTGDLDTYARLLFTELRTADDEGVDVLIAVLPPSEGLGFAIRDRLEKAAAPRPR